MVVVAAIASGYALVAAISIWIHCLVNKTWVFFVSDQVCFSNYYLHILVLFWILLILVEICLAIVSLCGNNKQKGVGLMARILSKYKCMIL